MSETVGILSLVWVFFAACGLLGMAINFVVADSDEERDRVVRAAGWLLVWPVWLVMQVSLMVVWALRRATLRC